MTILIPGGNISLGTKYEIVREESQENQNGTENTNRENRRIASLAVWLFGGAQFSAFWDGNSLQDDGTEAKKDISKKKKAIFLHFERPFK